MKKLSSFVVLSIALILVADPAHAFVPPRPGSVPPTGLHVPQMDHRSLPLFGQRASSRRGPSKASPFTPPVKGSPRFLVILVDFFDAPFAQPYPLTSHSKNSYSKTDFANLFFSETPFTDPKTLEAGINSMNNYYKTMSGGLFSISGDTNDIVGPFRMPQKISYYVDGNSGLNDTQGNAQDLAVDALNAAEAHGVDFSRYDNLESGAIDLFFVVHAGYGAEDTGSRSDLWSLRWQVRDKCTTANGKQAYDFIMAPELRCIYDVGNVCVDSGISSIGIVAHEFGHALGLPDLYDTNLFAASSGVGSFDIMGGGAWGGDGNSPNTPVSFSIWSKQFLGWLTPTVLSSSGPVSLVPIENTNTGYKIYHNGPTDTQYILVENRQKLGYDLLLPGSGLLLWRIDESMIDATMGTNSVNNDEGHRGVKLIEANGRDTLNATMKKGDGSVYFPGTEDVKYISRETKPSTAPYKAGHEATGDQKINVSLSSIAIDPATQDASFISTISSGFSGTDGESLPSPVRNGHRSPPLRAASPYRAGDGALLACSASASPVDTNTTTSPNGTATKETSGCFIATASFGYYDASEVRTLRAFRDRFLMHSSLGRLFVARYYEISPSIAESIGRNSLLMSATRLSLYPVIAFAHCSLYLGLAGSVAMFLGVMSILVAFIYYFRTRSASQKFHHTNR